MPQTAQVEKATLQEIVFGSASPAPQGQPFGVQFNPQTLKLNYSNQTAGGDQPQSSPRQYVGSGTTKLTVELLFDTTADDTTGDGSNPVDVRTKTDKVNYFMRMKDPPPLDDKGKPLNVPPAVRFAWGAFEFDGVMDSMDETLEYFSEMGVPLRSTVSISLSKQEIKPQPAAAKPGAPGTDPYAAARARENLPQLLARVGSGGNLRGVATANGLESLRSLDPGALVNVRASAAAPAAVSPAVRAVQQLLR